MELKDFVASTLIQIAEGIQIAQKHAQGLEDCRISPRHVPATDGKDVKCHIEYRGDSLECVNFDVAISTVSSGNAEGKAKIFVTEASINGKISHEQASRVSFQVYVQWPRHR